MNHARNGRKFEFDKDFLCTVDGNFKLGSYIIVRMKLLWYGLTQFPYFAKFKYLYCCVLFSVYVNYML